jgi:hypothetical protein
VSFPAALSPEEFIAKEEARTANAQDPTTYVNYKAEEMCKVAKGIDSPLGEALLAFHNRWAKRSTGRIAGTARLVGKPDVITSKSF